MVCLKNQGFSLCQLVLEVTAFIYHTGIWVDPNKETLICVTPKVKVCDGVTYSAQCRNILRLLDYLI